MFVIRDVATFVLTFDHRALDGAPAGRFLARLKRLLESPDSALFSNVSTKTAADRHSKQRI